MKQFIGTNLLMFMILTVFVSACAPATPVPPTSTPTPVPSPTPTKTPVPVVFFSADFENEIPSEFSGIAISEPVQGYEGVGTGTRIFSGNFLRNDSLPPEPTTLTLTGLPEHTSIDLHFLLAIIDSWDGTGSSCCGADSFNITVDGSPIFSEVFNNSVVGGAQSYVPPPGAELVRMEELGFRDTDGNDQDSGYDMSKDQTFSSIPHTSTTLTIEWYASGPGWQGDIDESWAIDSLEIILNVQDDLEHSRAAQKRGQCYLILAKGISA